MPRSRSVLAVLSLTVIFLSGCAAPSGALIVDHSPVIEGVSRNVDFLVNGEPVEVEAVRFAKEQQVTAIQTFTVTQDGMVLLSTDDATELPQGVNLTWVLRQDDTVVKSGKLQSLLVQPVAVELSTGNHTLEISAAAAYQYRNAPRGAAPDDMLLPRVIFEEVGR